MRDEHCLCGLLQAAVFGVTHNGLSELFDDRCTCRNEDA